MDKILALLLALVFSAAGAASAQPTVSPLIAGTYVHDLPPTTDKYLYMSGGPPAAGASWSGGVIHWSYNDANRPGGITAAAAKAQIQASMDKWHAAGCNVSFIRDDPDTS